MILEDDSKEKVSQLFIQRLPWLLVGLVGGILASVIVSRFENVISENISLAFFLPVIVYISDAVGTQTESIYIRNLGRGKVNFFTSLFKEMALGLSLGIIFGLLIFTFAYFWLNNFQIALTVATAMSVNVAIAPIIALIIPGVLLKEHRDPALGAGPFTTVIQDVISLSVYFLIAALILF